MVVVPSAQGRGVGRAMMEEVTRRADADGLPCYLESSRDVPNVRIYERFGFRFAAELECDDAGDAIRLFCMVRQPGAGPPEPSAT
jgi:GNAT superfamily N-acetyltransferase